MEAPDGAPAPDQGRRLDADAHKQRRGAAGPALSGGVAGSGGDTLRAAAVPVAALPPGALPAASGASTGTGSDGAAAATASQQRAPRSAPRARGADADGRATAEPSARPSCARTAEEEWLALGSMEGRLSRAAFAAAAGSIMEDVSWGSGDGYWNDNSGDDADTASCGGWALLVRPPRCVVALPQSRAVVRCAVHHTPCCHPPRCGRRPGPCSSRRRTRCP